MTERKSFLMLVIRVATPILLMSSAFKVWDWMWNKEDNENRTHSITQVFYSLNDSISFAIERCKTASTSIEIKSLNTLVASITQSLITYKDVLTPGQAETLLGKIRRLHYHYNLIGLE